MNTNLLETLLAIDESGSIAAAARKLNISAAAIAERIRLLEYEIDARVIERSGRTVSLTTAGSAVIPHAREIVKHVRDLKQHAHPGEVRGHLTVGAVSSALASLFPGALQYLAQRYSKLELKVVPGTSMHLFDQLIRGEIDCAVIVQPPFALTRAYRWDFLREEPFALLSRWSDPDLPIETVLRTRPFIRVDSSAWTGHLVTQYLTDRRIKPNVTMELDAFEATRSLIARGAGVSIMPDWGIEAGPETGIRKTYLDSKFYHRVVGLASANVSGQRNLVDAFLGVMRAETRAAAEAAGQHVSSGRAGLGGGHGDEHQPA